MEAVNAVWTIGDREVEVTQLDKVYWPAEGLTKEDVLAYYRALAPIMLPHLAGRPITVRAFPEGIDEPGFYRRSRPADAPDWVGGVAYRPEREGKPLDAILIENEASLIWLANAGNIEFHAWSARVPDLDEPDQAILDLDPGEQATFGDVRQAARRVKDAFDQLGLRGYPKTSGGRGLHVYVPLESGHAYEEVRQWVKAFGERLASDHPDVLDTPKRGTHQGDRVTVDYAQNAKGKNTAAPYTVRGLPGAPVSTPLTWEEIASDELQPSDFAMPMVPDRVRKRGDLFAPVLTDRQRLPRLGT